MITFLLWLFGIIYVGACLLLILFVLMQEGKAGGMGIENAGATPGAFTDSFGAGGAQQTLFNWTATAAGVFLTLAIVLTLLGNVREKAGNNLDLGGSAPAATAAAPNTATPAAPAAGTAPASAPAPAQ